MEFGLHLVTGAFHALSGFGQSGQRPLQLFQKVVDVLLTVGASIPCL